MRKDKLPEGANPTHRLDEFMYICPKDKNSRHKGLSFTELSEFSDICTLYDDQILTCYSNIDEFWTRADFQYACRNCPHAYNNALDLSYMPLSQLFDRELVEKHSFRNPYYIIEDDRTCAYFPGCHTVYFISDGEYVKIGVSNDVDKRLADLQTSNARPLKVVCLICCNSQKDAYSLERYLHFVYSRFKIQYEWFDILHYINLNNFESDLYSYDYFNYCRNHPDEFSQDVDEDE